MATEAQVAANWLNAQKSTGPRTPEGKAVVAQNAVKHGLLAREGVLRGEDWEEFARHREALMEELNPTGALEVILAARIVDLTWRLHRAAQDQNETFGALYDRHTAGAPEPAGPAQRGATLGRMILEDYSAGAVLERLLRYERRIEGSLLRNVSELRRVHDQRRKADGEAANTLARWREEDDRARKAQAFAPWRPADSPSPSRPDDPTTNTPQFEAPHQYDVPSCPDTPGAANAAVGHEMCETNPIGPEPNGSQASYGTVVMSASAPDGLRKTNPIWSAPRATGIPPVSPDHGWDAHATELTEPGSTEAPGGQSCETNPMGPEPDTSQALCCTAVMSAWAPEGPRKTNPIWSAPRGTNIPLVSPDHGRDAHATAPPGGDGVNLPTGQGRLCETNPICAFRSLAARETGSVPAGPHCGTLDGREKTCLREAV